MKRIKIWIKTIYYHIVAWKCRKNAEFLSINETLQQIIDKEKAFIRYGDGEFIIMNGGSIHYQDADKNLEDRLKKIINEYIHSNGEGRYLLGMPVPFFECSGLKLSQKRVWVSSWAKARYNYKKRFDLRNVHYGDAFLFSKQYEEEYKRIWIDVENVIFVHNNKIYSEKFKSIYNIETTFIKVPSKNAFSEYDDILKRILIELEKNRNKNNIVLISAGPSAKVLVYDLSKIGIKAIDTGHCWDEPLYIPN